MNRKLKLLILIIFPFFLTGCWDYIGIDEIMVVSGLAIDKSGDKYNLTFEFVDFNESSKEKGIVTKIIESSGNTIFDAIRNAKKRARKKLYFNQAQSIIISSKIAREDGLNSTINFFLRDGEIRETVKLVISGEEKASDILKAKSIDNPSVAYEIREIVDNDLEITGSTTRIALYELYNTLKNNSESVGIPLIRLVSNDNKKVIEANGIVVFKKDKAIGNLSPYESKFYLLIHSCLKGGLFLLKYKSKDYNVTLEIAESKTKQSYTHEKEKYQIKIENTIIAYVGEYEDQKKELTEKNIDDIQKEAAKMIEKNVKKLVDKAKNEYKYDIFSFGNLIANKDPKEWHKVEKKWSDLFINADIEIKSRVKIENTALLR